MREGKTARQRSLKTARVWAHGRARLSLSARLGSVVWIRCGSARSRPAGSISLGSFLIYMRPGVIHRSNEAL